MKAVMIGAGEEALHTIAKAQEHGVSVLALDGSPQAAGLSAADRGLVVDISRESDVIETVRREGADFALTAPIGRYLTTAGAVNDALGMPGITRRMAQLCTDKYLFHEKLSRAGLRSCHCYEIAPQAGTRPAAEQFAVEYPAILKPRYGSGSRGIFYLRDSYELTEALSLLGGEDYVLEDCVPGEEYGIDGAVVQGRFYMILLRKKINTPPPARQAVGYFACGMEDAFWQEAHDHVEKVVHCLGLKECLLHCDVIRGAEGPFVIELSARPSGHNLHNLFTPLCTGVDPAEEYIKYRLGEPFSFVPKQIKPMMIHYFDGQGQVARVPDRIQIETVMLRGAKESARCRLLAWRCNLMKGEVLGTVCDGHSVMGRGYYILEGTDRQQLEKTSGQIMDYILYQ